MPTSKPRLTVTLEPHRYELLRRLSGLQGVSASFILTDLLETVAPVLERACVALENAQQASRGIKDNLRRVAHEAESVLLPQAEGLMGQIDMFLNLMTTSGGEAAPDGDASPPAASAVGNPRPVITGVRSSNPPPHKKARNPATKRATGKKGKGGHGHAD